MYTSSIDESILNLLEQTSKTSRRYIQRLFDEKGLNITVDQWNLMKILEDLQGLSQNQLAAKSGKDCASITRTLDILEKKNFINREPIPNNRRQHRISLTATGLQFLQNNKEIFKKHRAKCIDGFFEIEVSSLRLLLQRLEKNMK